jgi:hypothetical protein
MYIWIAMCMRAQLAHVAFKISDHSSNFLETPRTLYYFELAQPAFVDDSYLITLLI